MLTLPPSVSARPRAGTVTTVVIAGLAVAAWLVLWRAGSDVHGSHGDSGSDPAPAVPPTEHVEHVHGSDHHGSDHHGSDHHGSDVHGQAPLFAFVGGWMLMLVAMMLPTTAPLMRHVATVARGRPDRVAVLGAVVVGYLAVWGVVGLAAFSLDRVVHGIHEQTGWLEGREWAVAVAALVLAAGYQLSPIKDQCLSGCRSTRMLVYSRWRGRNPVGDALGIGATHGRWCAACCWALMLLMLAVGTWALGWMLVLATVMALEKNAPWGARLTKPIGIVLLLVAGVVVIVNV